MDPHPYQYALSRLLPFTKQWTSRGLSKSPLKLKHIHPRQVHVTIVPFIKHIYDIVFFAALDPPQLVFLMPDIQLTSSSAIEARQAPVYPKFSTPHPYILFHTLGEVVQLARRLALYGDDLINSVGPTFRLIDALRKLMDPNSSWPSVDPIHEARVNEALTHLNSTIGHQLNLPVDTTPVYRDTRNRYAYTRWLVSSSPTVCLNPSDVRYIVGSTPTTLISSGPCFKHIYCLDRVLPVSVRHIVTYITRATVDKDELHAQLMILDRFPPLEPSSGSAGRPVTVWLFDPNGDSSGDTTFYTCLQTYLTVFFPNHDSSLVRRYMPCTRTSTLVQRENVCSMGNRNSQTYDL
jgi:hypothetical protein